ncbi:MAG: hypothetical protein M0037_00275 [Betaproteobacteria bacterium]|nr:hypothetical protein [Betaproteobacteria bacterium]
MKTLLALMIAVGVLSACTPPPQPRYAPTRINLEGFPPAYKAGYRDGCDSAQSGRYRKDRRRFKSDPEYHTGWDDGYGLCRRH